MEILDIVDKNGVPTGDTVSREQAHREGIRHRTSHVWLARYRDESVWLLLQRRSEDKDSHPGLLDISSAGHIPAGCTYMESALRELSEELGVSAKYQDLHFCGKRRKAYKKIFHGREFFDNQVSNVYVMFKDIEASDIIFQESEISEVLWMRLNDVYTMVALDESNLVVDLDGQIIKDDRKNNKSCIALEEMNMLKNYIADHPELYINV